MFVEILEGDKTLGTADFDPGRRETEVVCGNICLSAGLHNLRAKLVLQNLNADVTFGYVKLYTTKNGAQKQCVNVNTGLSTAIENDGSSTKNWFEQDYCQLQYGSTVLNNVVFTTKDYALTLISRLQHPTAFNVWYNDGKNMLYQVSDVTLVINNVSYSVDTIQVCTLSSAIGKTTFEYIVPSSGYLYKTRRVTSVSGDGVVAEELVNSKFQTAKVVDEKGVVTEYTYNAYGSVTKETTTAPTGTLLNIEESSSYHANNLLKSSTEKRYFTNYSHSFVYGDDYELTQETAPNAQVTQFAYSADKDKLTSISSTIDNQTSQNDVTYQGDLVDTLSDSRTIVDFEYDERQNVSQVKIANTAVINKVITYNENGTTQSVTTYGNGQKIKKYYDAYDRLVKVSDVTASENVLAQYVYSDTEIDPAVSDPTTAPTVVGVNSPLRAVVDRVVGLTTRYTYDEFGQVKKVENQDIVTTQTTDEYNRVDTISCNLNSGGNMQTLYQYASSTDDALISETTNWDMPGTITTAYTYDGLQRPKATTVRVGNNGYKQAFSYVPRQVRKKVSTGGNETVTGEVVPSFELVTTDVGTTRYVSEFKEYTVSGTAEILVRTDAVEYDENGNISKYGNVTYQYDNLNRLVRENNPTLDKTTIWSYDISGNICTRTEYAYTTGAVGTATATFAYSYANGWKDQLTSFGGQNIVYDQAGNPTSYKGATLSWTRGRLLASYTPSGSIYTTTMQYDAEGRRCRKTIPTSSQPNTFSYIYNGNNLIRETKSDTSSATKTYLYNSQGIIGFVYQGVTYTYRKNLFGDIVAIYQGATKVAEYAYDAWGNQKVMNGNSIEVTDLTHIAHINPFRYRGYYWDADLQLYYLMSRYYDPQTGRFINADSLEYLDPETIGGLNLYAYCGNNPIMYSDDTGHMPEWLKTAIVVAAGVAVVAAVAAITVFTGGTAAPVLVGAALGVASSGISSAVMQIADTGSIDISKLFIDMTVGGVLGAFGGSAISRFGMTIAGGATGFASSVAEDWVKGRAINIESALNSATIGALFGFNSGAGKQFATRGATSAIKGTLGKISSRTGSWNKGLTKIYKNKLNRISNEVISQMKSGFGKDVGTDIIQTLFDLYR